MPTDITKDTPKYLRICGEVEFPEGEGINAADSGEKSKIPTFTMKAYTGGPMNLGGWYYPVVLDLTGIQVSGGPKPILRDHDTSRIVGHSTKISVDSILKIEGLISGKSEHAQEVLDLSAGGFPWQSSIGAQAKKVRFVKEKEVATVNGKEFKGPLYVVEKSRLKGTSFVALGADEDSSASVAAQAPGDSISGQNEGVQAMPDNIEDVNGQASGTVAPAVSAAAPAVDVVAQMREEQSRISAIQASCAGVPEIAAQAIKEGWSAEKAELHALRAAQTRKDQDGGVAAAFIGGGDKPDLPAIKAAVCLSNMVPEKDVLARYGEKPANQSSRYRRMGIRELASVCCMLDGVQAPRFGASEAEWARAAFSSASFSDLLSDSANQSMMSAYNAVPSVARIIAAALSANDFKTHKGVRLTGDLTFNKVENGGEITHGTLADDSYSFAVDTYGRLIGLTRQDLVNDSMGAFLQLPRMFGRGAALAVEQAFWTLVLANTGSFFSGGNANLITGAGTVLSIDGLSSAVQTLEEQTDQDSNPILVKARYLVVPPALKAIAQQLYVSEGIIAGTSTAKQPAANVHRNAYEPLSTPYLKSAATAWYLFGDPMDVSAFGIAWLNGIQEPVVEEVATPPEYLGRTWRGYLDFGVCQMDKRGAVKSAGA